VDLTILTKVSHIKWQENNAQKECVSCFKYLKNVLNIPKLH